MHSKFQSHSYYSCLNLFNIRFLPVSTTCICVVIPDLDMPSHVRTLIQKHDTLRVKELIICIIVILLQVFFSVVILWHRVARVCRGDSDLHMQLDLHGDIHFCYRQGELYYPPLWRLDFNL